MILYYLILLHIIRYYYIILYDNIIILLNIILYYYYIKNKMKPTNPNAHTYGYSTDVKTHGYAVTHNIFLQ